MKKVKVEIMGMSDHWVLYLDIGGDTLTHVNHYKTRASALRAAKRVANKLGITLEVK